MKKLALLLSVISIMIVFPLAAFDVYSPMVEWGDWAQRGNRLYQNDEKTSSSRIHWAVEQEGMMLYDFNVRYEGGGIEDLHGGFGIHIFGDNPSKGYAWGSGDSYLLWLNYDADPAGSDVPAGLSAQIYKSVSNSKMNLLQSISLKDFEYLLTTANADELLKIRLKVDGDTGDAWIYSPIDPSYRWKFNLGNRRPIDGDYISLRTNSLALSFGLN
ncbi:MAG: hypothetical protein JEY99_06350 [Spirochaetales bacterium]|nr:hypothetical protein [Spirochaetales bacterium]